MPRQLPPLASLRAFEAAARHLSFKAAAEELNVTATAISHQVRQLESQLGLRLFERQTRQVALTWPGQRLYPVLRDGLDAFAAAIEALGRPVRPVVTVSATTAFTARWLVPRVPDWQAKHPGIDLRLHASNLPVDLHGGVADLAIRYGRGPYPGLRATPLLDERFVPLASPRLQLREPADLARCRLIQMDWTRRDPALPGWRDWLHAAAVPGVDAEAGPRFSDEAHAAQAAVAGAGVALLSEVLVQHELAQGLLCIPFGPALPGLAYHLVEPARHSASPALEAARRWLLEAAAACAAEA